MNREAEDYPITCLRCMPGISTSSYVLSPEHLRLLTLHFNPMPFLVNYEREIATIEFSH